MKSMHISELSTPSLVLDLDRVERNCDRMIERARALGVALRPHMKTAKSVHVARMATRGQSAGITVSTLAEIDYFGRAGFQDITYAVGITPQKLPQIIELRRRHNCRVHLLVDSPRCAMEVVRQSGEFDFESGVLIEIDCGGGRGGVGADGEDLLSIAQIVTSSPKLSLLGVLTHAGQSYKAETVEQIKSAAEQERSAAVLAAKRLHDASFATPVVSVGSTPTIVFASSMSGVTEIRPGVYTLFDLDQVALGTCEIDDIAVSVLATVIGYNSQSNCLLIDAGALALSKDLSAANSLPNLGFGLVCSPADAQPIDNLYVCDVHQEHGFIRTDPSVAKAFPVGARVRILPNHACMTAAPYDRYYVTRGADPQVLFVWDKATGWSV